MDAYTKPDYRSVALIADALSGLYERGTAEMQNIGVSLLTTKEFLASMKFEEQKG